MTTCHKGNLTVHLQRYH